MSRNFSVTEPHPSISKKGGYIGGGIGGAGNFKRYQPGELSTGPDAAGPASRVALSSKPTRQTVLAGRGGAGNMFRRSTSSDSSDEALFKFDEEMSRRSRDANTAAPVYRVGRGGAGNTFGDSSDTPFSRTSRMGSTDSSASISSGGSDASVRRSLENAFGRFSRKLSARP
ncbi:hypothetical protein K431DRAFT_4276 [Polychaeton citri CBS 116435]|uniref:Uncharacterized protein n=1 Tax=Polychaeton citri CBS 116435 TaxID=1314669 RepID=A0A9P4QI74_9PEZI|nr:hypothetical protein K431DRAFT_4276 [Polychaeton citri CBS 116435]